MKTSLKKLSSKTVAALDTLVCKQAESEFISAWKFYGGFVFEGAKKSGYYDGKPDDGQKILLMHAELSEGVEALRGAPFPGLPDKHLPHRPGIEVELADLIIRAMNYGSMRGLDIPGAIIEKVRFNATRPKNEKRF